MVTGGACACWLLPFSESACSVTAEERVKHGQLHALLVSPTPRDHRPLTVSRVQMMPVTGERQTYDRSVGLWERDLSDWLQVPRAPQPDHPVLQSASDHID